MIQTFKYLCTFIFTFILTLGFYINLAYSAGFQNLSFLGNYLEKHPIVQQYFLPSLRQIEKDLNNAITFQYKTSTSLHSDREIYQAINKGEVDFGLLRPSIFPNSMTRLNIVDIPGIAQNPIVGTLLINDIIENHPEVLLDYPENALPFTAWTSAECQLHSIMPIKNLNDIKNKRIIIWDERMVEVVKLLGAIPIYVTSNETPRLLNRGLADAVIAPIGTIRAFELTEFLKYQLLLNFGTGAYTVSVYKPLWESFTPEIQNYLRQTGGTNFGLGVAITIMINSKQDIDYLTSIGYETSSLSKSDRLKLNKILEGLKVKWIIASHTVGFENAEELMTYVEERAAYYQEEFNKGTYGNFNF